MIKETDVIIVGGGPLGIELAVLLKRNNIDYLHFEARQIGDTISKWPRQTQFFSAPERVALAGIPVHSPNQQSLTGEMYLGYLRSVVEQCQLSIRTYEPVVDIQKEADGRFLLTTASLTGQNQVRCQRLVLATGNMNFPRQLGIEGEALPHVHHRLDDPHDYFQKRVLIVGGKNSALEAALRTWRAGAQVAISYRRAEFETSIVKPHLAREIGLLIDKGMIDFYPGTEVRHLEEGAVYLGNNNDGSEKTVAVDFVLFCIGFEMDMTLYEKVGITLKGQARTPEFYSETMETDVPNVYICGTAAGAMEAEHELFIMTSHDHAEKIAAALTGKRDHTIGDIPRRSYNITFDEIKED